MVDQNKPSLVTEIGSDYKPLRNSCKFVPYKDRKAVCADLKKIYGAVYFDEAEFAKEELRENGMRNIRTS